MEDKYLDGVGVKHLWKKTNIRINQAIEEASGLGGESGSGGNVLKITFAEGFKGQTYTVTGNGMTPKTGIVPDILIARVNVPDSNTEYTVTCKAINGETYSAAVITGEYFAQYTVELNTFEATLTVSTQAGAVVSVQKEGYPAQTETADESGQATFALYSTSSYTVTATYEGVNSDTQTVTPQTEWEELTATLTFITLTVTAEPGSYLTVTNGDTIKSGITSGTSTFYLPNTGQWVVTAALSEQVRAKTVDISFYGAFSVSVFFSVVVGVTVNESNLNPETAVTYTDDAVSMQPGYEAWKDHQIFNDIRPCVVKDGVVQYYLNRDDMNQKEDGSSATLDSIDEGDVMIEIPKLGYKMTNDGTNVWISVTDDPDAEGYCYRAHSLEEEGDCDKIYIGAYLGYLEGSKLYSISGKNPTFDNSGLNNFRTCAQARGTGYQLISFYPLTLLQCLYLIMFKNRDGQTALGMGATVDGAGPIVTGSSNDQKFCYGETTGTKQMKFLGVEGFWGSLYSWIDGCYIDSQRSIKTAFRNFNDLGTGYPYIKASGVTSNLGGYVSKIQGTNEGGFFSKEANASDSTGWADNSSFYINIPLMFSYPYNHSGKIPRCVGPFRMVLYTPPGYAACRLIYKHKEGTP